MKTALITGITGQDGSYLADLLIEKGYKVIGVARGSASKNWWRIDHIPEDSLTIEIADLLDQSSLDNLVKKYKPDEVYNLAAQSFVPLSWSQPVYTAEVDALGVTRILEAIKNHHPEARFYQASSSEMFGKVHEMPQTETTPFHPRSPYGVCKVYGHYMTQNYRESYGLHASSGILFNHESPRRGLEFVTRKVTNGAALISVGAQENLDLGNLDAQRDWGHAKDYVRAMWLMLQQDKPDDYVIATGKTQSIRDLCWHAFRHAGLHYKHHVRSDPKFIRPAEVDVLLGDASKAKEKLGWEPEISFEEMICEMVDFDLKFIHNEV